MGYLAAGMWFAAALVAVMAVYLVAPSRIRHKIWEVIENGSRD